MDKTLGILAELVSDERAVSMGEYALLMTFLTLGTISIVSALTDAINTFFHATASDLGDMAP